MDKQIYKSIGRNIKYQYVDVLLIAGNLIIGASLGHDTIYN